MQYRRHYHQGASYFLTVNLINRSSDLLIKEIETLRNSFKTVKQKYSFYIDAIVILPDHIHMVCTLPDNDAGFSKRIKLIKYYFSYRIAKIERISKSRCKKGERGIWQRRFWEHCMRNETDYRMHIDYIHMNLVRHVYVKRVQDWQYSSFHRFVAEGLLPVEWSD